MAMTPDAARSASKNPLTLRNNQRSLLEGGVVSNGEASIALSLKVSMKSEGATIIDGCVRDHKG